jgi:DNA-binding MarR family transcriptional regulator
MSISVSITPLTFSRFQVLDTLRCTGPNTQHGLAKAMSVSDTVISRMMKALQKLNYINIRQDPHHGRKHIIALTDFGLKQIQELGNVLEMAFQKVLLSSVEDLDRFGMEINAILKTLQEEGVIL